MRLAIIAAVHLTAMVLLGAAADEKAAANRVRVPSADVNKPIPLPILAKPTLDRAPLTDATIEASKAAAPVGAAAVRSKPMPFLKLTLPDPYENRRTVVPPATLTEELPNQTPGR